MKLSKTTCCDYKERRDVRLSSPCSISRMAYLFQYWCLPVTVIRYPLVFESYRAKASLHWFLSIR
ncbi:hypothetical protein [Algicola sagamiensis]|uniref:hypothetical protein n=1 Tax=Algicola sagamiensis TaxID=163869 RepID=UPI0003AA63D5|nr:hypothetical protein [Algicola sagamiensis]